MSMYNDASLALIPSAVGDGVVYNARPVEVLGAEMVTNGDFATDTDWTKATGWTISGGKAIATAANNNADILQDVGLVSGTTYKIEVTISGYSAGSLRMNFLGTGGGQIGDFTANGTYIGYAVGGSDARLQIVATTTTTTLSIDNVSVKETSAQDFDFTRASEATRVLSGGRIEKVRTNSLLNSNNFTSWSTSGAPILTSGQTGYDGSSDAWLFDANSGGYIVSVQTSSGVNTFSIYAKAASNDFLFLYNVRTGTDPTAYFNLSTGTTGTLTNCITTDILSVGNDWYRCSMTFTDGDINLRVYSGSAEGSLSDGTIYIQDAQNEQGTVATDYIETTSTSVSVGSVNDMPRLDWSGGCPSLLLEPQRTNACTYSESLTSWLSERVSVTANATSSPSGHTNSDKMVSDATADTTHQVYIGPFTNTAGNVVLSGYFKKGEYDWLHFGQGAPDSKAWFNVNTGQVGTLSSLVVSTSITDAGNGWFRCVSLLNVATTTNYVEFGLATADGSRTISGTPPEGGLYGWGIQMEDASSYATSYIPSYGTATTRVQDSCSKTGISSLIGQTEGTMFFEGSVLANDNTFKFISITDGTSSNVVWIYYRTAANAINFRVVSGGVSSFDGIHIVTDATTVNKLALKYKANDFAAWVNGVEVLTSSSGSTFTAGTLTDFEFNRQDDINHFTGNINQTLLFPYALSDTELEKLTTL